MYKRQYIGYLRAMTPPMPDDTTGDDYRNVKANRAMAPPLPDDTSKSKRDLIAALRRMKLPDDTPTADYVEIRSNRAMVPPLPDDTSKSKRDLIAALRRMKLPDDTPAADYVEIRSNRRMVPPLPDDTSKSKRDLIAALRRMKLPDDTSTADYVNIRANRAMTPPLADNTPVSTRLSITANRAMAPLPDDNKQVGCPKCTLVADSTGTNDVTFNTEYTELGAVCTDASGNKLDYVVTGTPKVPGRHIVTYSAVDADGKWSYGCKQDVAAVTRRVNIDATCNLRHCTPYSGTRCGAHYGQPCNKCCWGGTDHGCQPGGNGAIFVSGDNPKCRPACGYWGNPACEPFWAAGKDTLQQHHKDNGGCLRSYIRSRVDAAQNWQPGWYGGPNEAGTAGRYTISDKCGPCGVKYKSACTYGVWQDTDGCKPGTSLVIGDGKTRPFRWCH
jgi:hypothetical protein